MSRSGPATRRPPGPPARRPVGADRFAARTRRRVVRRVLAILGAVAVLGAAGAVGWLVGWSDVTALDGVEVTGADGELRDAVADAADAPFGTPLVRVDTDELAAGVEELAEVAEASVRRSWPRSVVIEVTPRVPVAVVAQGSQWWQVDSEGTLFGPSPQPPAGLPEIEAPTGSGAADTAARAAGVAVVAGLPDELAARVASVAAPTDASVELTLDDGATVMWGTAADGARKAEVLLALLAEEASAYDVSAPERPATRP